MPWKIICLGKTKDAYLEEGIEEYCKRIQPFLNIKWQTLPDVSLIKTINKEMVKKKEGETILKNIMPNDFVIALDEKGKQFTSREFAVQLTQITPSVTFVIGGVYGLAQEVLDRADLILSFSLFTFTHQMVRLILMEQLYRACTINKGKSYHY